MRVAIVSKEFPPRLSGIGDHTDHLAAELAGRGHDVTVVCASPADRRDAFAVESIGSGWNGAARDAIVKAVAASHPDVILWAYNPFSFGRRGLPIGAGATARALANVAPLVALFHEIWFPWGRAGLRGLAWAVAQRKEARGVLRAAKRWVVTTESRESELRTIDAGKVRRIPVGTNVVATATEKRRDRLGIAQGSLVFAHLGSAGPGRDLEPAFDAIRLLRAQGLDVRFLLAGSTGPVTIPHDLEAAVGRTGVVAREELSAALAAADVYLHADPVGPSAGRRTTLVAALAHGLPVIAYSGPDAAPQLIDGRNVLLIERTGAALAGALKEMADHPERRRALGEAAKQTYDAEFSWRKIGDETVAVLEEAIGR